MPGNWQILLETTYDTISQLSFDNINREEERYFPFISILFTFILSSNLIPYSFTVTSHLVVTFTLSLSIFIGVNMICIKRYKACMLSLSIPANTSFGLTLLLFPTEFVSYIFKPISLKMQKDTKIYFSRFRKDESSPLSRIDDWTLFRKSG